MQGCAGVVPPTDTTPDKEVVDAELDDTGKRDRPVREKRVSKPRGPSRYLKTGRALIANPVITQEALAKSADVSIGTAGYCLEAWRGLVAAMKEAGWLSQKAQAVLKAVEPKKATSKTSK